MEKFKKIVEELSKNIDLVNEVSKMENIDEIYEIFKNIDPELKKEELNNLIEKIENSDLENIAGGVSFNKKVLSSSLGALITLSPLAGAIHSTQPKQTSTTIKNRTEGTKPKLNTEFKLKTKSKLNTVVQLNHLFINNRYKLVQLLKKYKNSEIAASFYNTAEDISTVLFNIFENNTAYGVAYGLSGNAVLNDANIDSNGEKIFTETFRSTWRPIVGEAYQFAEKLNDIELNYDIQIMNELNKIYESAINNIEKLSQSPTIINESSQSSQSPTIINESSQSSQ